MIIIEPIPVTDAVLASSSVPEATVAEYAAGTTYALNDQIGVTTGTAQIIYRSLQAGNIGNTPASSPTWWAVVGTVYAAYSGAATYAAADIVSSIAANVHLLYESLVAGNIGNALTDATKWLPLGATNQRKMFDALNNTQTVNAESIAITLTPVMIANGFYLGNVDADSVTVTVTDAIDGVVFDETQSLIQSNSGSSFFNWFFKRIARKTYAVSVLLPMYAGATISITISKPGGTAKCGMCVIGPVVDIGMSQSGLGTEIKDYSTTRFNVDGTSTTVERGYSKRMTLDVILDNDVIDSVQDILAGYRQTPVVYIGAVLYGSTLIYGKFSSFKNVIAYLRESRMALTIDGMV